MEIKNGISLSGLQPIMRPVLREAERIWTEHKRPEGVTITCCCEGTHGAVSWHYYGYALDLRTRYFTADQVNEVYWELRESLPNYDVVSHDTHIHVEINNQLAVKLGVFY